MSVEALKQQIADVEVEARRLIEGASEGSLLEDLRVRYLGRRGALTQILREIGALPPADRPALGQLANACKARLEAWLAERGETLRHREFAARLRSEAVDITLPGTAPSQGHLHPITQTLQEIVEIFHGLGFRTAEGPEVELDFYNFEALNIPRDHPARDMQDTFYVSDEVVLRTHTSPVQIRVMEHTRPPLRIISPGKVYRCDADISHAPMFHQVEGFYVDEGVRMSDLKGTLETFVHQCFGPATPVRFRPSFFPFTEPSAEVDIGCALCGGSARLPSGEGCRVCKQSGWVEILGAGMIDPAVFEAVRYDPERHTGFAFGMGVERIAMLKYGIDDIRLFFDNDLRFLRQF